MAHTRDLGVIWKQESGGRELGPLVLCVHLMSNRWPMLYATRDSYECSPAQKLHMYLKHEGFF